MSDYVCALPGLTRTAVEHIAGEWDDGGLWDDIQMLAGRFYDARDDATRLICWHHLVLAVGNFKRQPGRRLRPTPLARLSGNQLIDRANNITLPGANAQQICAENPRSWEFLMSVLPGARVATTTTLLAALWPDRHIVFDRRVYWAANALRIHAGLSASAGVEPDSSH